MDKKKKAQQFFEEHDIGSYKDIKENELYAKNKTMQEATIITTKKSADLANQRKEKVETLTKIVSEEIEKSFKKVEKPSFEESVPAIQSEMAEVKPLNAEMADLSIDSVNAETHATTNVVEPKLVEPKMNNQNQNSVLGRDPMDDRVYKFIGEVFEKGKKANIVDEDEFIQLWQSSSVQNELSMLRSEAYFAKKAELRRLGMPFEESLDGEIKANFYGKFLSAMAFLSGALFEKGTLFSDIMAGEVGFSHALAIAGLLGFATTSLIARKTNLKYRAMLAQLAEIYEDSYGAIDEEEILAITGADTNIYPDEYKMAVMTEEEREEIFANMPKQSKMSKRKQIKAIKKLIRTYEADKEFARTKEDKDR